MTIGSSSVARMVYSCNGTTTVFAVTIQGYLASDFEVIHTTVAGVESILVLNSDYSMAASGSLSPTYWTLTTTLTYPAGDTLQIFINPPQNQQTQYVQGQAFPSLAVQTNMDRLTQMVQRLQDQINRSIVAPDGDVTPAMTLPDANIRAGLGVMFDSLGNLSLGTSVSGTITGAIIASLLSLVTTSAPTADKVRTASEITLGITPTNYSYPAGHAWRYGADPTGAVNATTALYNMYKVCIGNGVTTGCDGVIPPGTYKLTPGVLIFNNGFTNMAWPNIRTGGYRQTIFLVDPATATNNPILTWSNGTATGTSGNFWYGGSHGGLTISDQTGATAGNRHGISLTGIWGCHFGYIRGLTLTGNVINVPLNLYGGGDPDPYAVNLCNFDAVEAFFCVGAAINNLNYVGMNGCTVTNLFVATSGGGWIGLGAQNTCVNASMEAMAGYCFDDGCFAADTGGEASKFTLINGELDNCEYCFRYNICLTMNILACRIIHRYQTAPNVAATYWPAIAVQFGAGTTPNIQQVNMQLTHRLEAGGTHANIGTWVDFANAGGVVTGVTVDNALDNESAIAIVDTDYYSNYNTNTLATVTVLGRRIIDTQVKNFTAAYGNGTTAVPNAGYGTAAAKILFPVEQYDEDSCYATSQYTAPWTGQYEFRVRLRLTMASGSSLRLGILDTTGPTALADATFYAASSATQSYELTGVVTLTAGDVIYPMAQQSTGGSITCDAGLGQQSSNIFQVRAL